MDYPYVYIVLPDSEVKILTPWCKSLHDVKTTIEQYPDKVVNHSVYPNGLDLYMENHGDKIVVRSNRSLIENGDGTFTAPE